MAQSVRQPKTNVAKSGQTVESGVEKMPDDMPVESSILYHIFILNSVLERAGNRVSEAHGLTLPQWMALGCISHGGAQGISHSELGHKLMLSKAPITGVVDRLERAEYVRREVSASDRRVSRIHVTPSGEMVWENVRATMRDLAIEQCSDFSNQEKDQLLEWLSRLLNHVAASDPILVTLPPCAVKVRGVAAKVETPRSRSK